MSKRLARVNETLQHELSAVIKKEIADPRLSDVTITEVDVSPDLKHAVVYVTSLTIKIDDVLKALRKAKGFLKNHVSTHLKLKYLPDLEFKEDESFERAERIENIIKKIHEED